MPAKQSKKSKFGRNKVKCERYRARVGKPSAAGSKKPRSKKRARAVLKRVKVMGR